MNIYEIFDNLRYHYENKVVEFKNSENNFNFDDIGYMFMNRLTKGSFKLTNRYIIFP